MHYAEVVALWYICIIKSVCGLLKVLVVCLQFHFLWFDIIQNKIFQQLRDGCLTFSRDGKGW